MWWNRSKRQILILVLLAAVLAGAFWLGGNAPGSRGWAPEAVPSPAAPSASAAQTEVLPAPSVSPTPAPSTAPTVTPEPAEPPEALPVSPMPEEMPAAPLPMQTPAPLTPPPSAGAGASVLQGMGGTDPSLAAPAPEGNPQPVDPQDAAFSDVAHTCTLSVRCDTILDHLDWLDAEKAELVPEDGVIFPETQVTFYEGESVFNLLQREMKQAKIHLEFEETPLYHSAYIEGIHNLYEFDCGEGSGWTYRVNGWFPNYGCSRYQLQEGDVVEWLYTCDLGADVGALSSVGGA